MAIYDLFAPHYDAVTGDSTTEAAFIDHILRRAYPQPVTLLEVACGTGGIIESLADRYQVAGLDISPGMLAVARAKLPAGTPLHLADMSRFSLGARFDAVICVYHGINHLLGFPAWESFFDCVLEHLNEGGIFIFDVLTLDNLQKMTSSPEMVQRFGDNCLRVTVHTSDGAVFGWNFEVLELQRDGAYKSLTEIVDTTSFPPAQIRASLSARFAGVKMIESDGSLAGAGEDRTWFVCAGPRPGA
ncbi:MAG: class I SAM-dependent methyltransferase [Nocardiopsaceae bacterium]|jgi:SAM-dependent methyltransferase|nr:class I SAM-dependent methyltransferase [Nocardiopsaceae bacterium]